MWGGHGRVGVWVVFVFLGGGGGKQAMREGERAAQAGQVLQKTAPTPPDCQAVN